MLKLADLKPGSPLVGLEPAVVATVAAVVPIGEGSVQVFYRTPDGTTQERLLGRADEENLSVATVERPWSFDGDGAAFQLTWASHLDLEPQLIRVINTDGETGAATVFAAVQSKTETARQLAYRRYTLCERKNWAEDARAYNEVVTSWSGIESAAAQEPTATQRSLFD